MKTETVKQNSKNFNSLAKDSRVKGFNDYIGEEALKRAEIKKILVDTFERYGFNPVETPVIEYEEFVRGDASGSEGEKDEAISDIFRLKDKGDRELALRYEFTFQLKRLMRNQKLPFRRYSLGEVFRDEPVSANRYRQFVQADVDVVGSTVKDEAEILSLISEVLKKLGIEFKIYLGNRQLLNEILNNLGVKDNANQILREIDKLGKISVSELKKNLKKLGAEKVLNFINLPEKEYEKYSSYKYVKDLKNALKNYGINVEFSPSLVRGLGYYNGNVWEIKTKKSDDSLGGGGSYEFNGVQCTGFAFGLDRISSLAKVPRNWNSVLIVSLDEDKQATKVAQKLRDVGGNRVSIYYGKPSKALEYANSYDYNQVIFVGAKEVKQKKVKVKDMISGREKLVTMQNISKKNLIFQRK